MRFAWIIGALAVLMVTGCGKKMQDDDTPITLKLWTHEDPNRQRLEEGYATAYMAAHPNVTIEYSVYPSGRIQDLISTAYASRNAPSIWNLELQKAYPLLAQGICAPLDPAAIGARTETEIIDMYLEHMLDPVVDAKGELGPRGKIYGLSLELNNWCMYLNKKIFRDAGLDPETEYPKTWEDVMAVSERIVRRTGNTIIRRGFDFRYPDYLISWVPMVNQLGGRVVSDDGTEAITNLDAWTRVLEYMQEFGPNGKNLGSPTYKRPRTAFDTDSNEIALSLSGLYQEARIATVNPDFYTSGEWMVIPYPVFVGGLDLAGCYYFQYYMVNSQIPEREQREAWRFISFMLSHPEDYLNEVALVQPRRSLIESDAYKNMPYSGVFLDDLARAEPVYYGAASWQINQLINEAIEEVMLNNVSPRTAAEKLKRSAQRVLDETE
ncbi:MAG: extracellular solute-binding protein [Treponema sp.]|nr:extracellular solute-binding protein [Treponema sp.]